METEDKGLKTAIGRMLKDQRGKSKDKGKG